MSVTFVGVEKIKFFATYPRENIELDSTQTRQIRAIICSMSMFETKNESRRIDSVILEKLNVIGSQQIVFQNKVIDRYDDKVEILTKNQSEIIGVLKALHYFSDICQDTSVPAKIVYQPK